MSRDENFRRFVKKSLVLVDCRRVRREKLITKMNCCVTEIPDQFLFW